MNTVCIFSCDQVTHGITAMHCYSVIWAATDIRLIVKITAQGLIWADTDIRLIVKTSAQSVI